MQRPDQTSVKRSASSELSSLSLPGNSSLARFRTSAMPRVVVLRQPSLLNKFVEASNDSLASYGFGFGGDAHMQRPNVYTLIK